MEEIWKDIKGYEGVYQVSNLGNVRSVDRQIKQRNARCNNYDRIIKGRVLKQTLNRRGYKMVTLCKNNKKTAGLIHKLVAQTFLTNPNNYSVINHIDGNKENNCTDNLEFCTNKHNVNEAIRLGLFNPKKQITNKKCIQRDLEENIINIYESIQEASRLTGISSGNITTVCKGKRNYAGGYKWEYANKEG